MVITLLTLECHCTIGIDIHVLIGAEPEPIFFFKSQNDLNMTRENPDLKANYLKHDLTCTRMIQNLKNKTTQALPNPNLRQSDDLTKNNLDLILQNHLRLDTLQSDLKSKKNKKLDYPKPNLTWPVMTQDQTMIRSQNNPNPTCPIVTPLWTGTLEPYKTLIETPWLTSVFMRTTFLPILAFLSIMQFL